MPILFQDRAGISLYDAQFSGPTRGPISPPTTGEVIHRLAQFQLTCDDFQVPKENIYVLATEATRTASNSEEFRARIKEYTGWEVTLLSKEDEGRIGALGIASSSASVAGIAMDLGGGSTQITWVMESEGTVTTSPKGSFSFPYGAAALTKRLEEAQKQGKDAVKELKSEMTRNIQDAYRQLDVPNALVEMARRRGRFDLYLCGGGFRGWGYVLMKQSKVNPYPIPIINGFRVKREDFHDTVSVLEVISDSDEKIFGVSERRASQIPAVAVLVDVIMDALPEITHIQFCQGGRSASPGPPPRSNIPRESRSAAALHSTTTGLLSSTNCLSHVERALIALVLCERWTEDLAPMDQAYHKQLSRCLTAQEVWWARYLGRVAVLVGDVYPAGRVEGQWRIRIETQWEEIEKKERRDLLRVNVWKNVRFFEVLEEDRLRERTEKVEKVGKRKKWVSEYGVKVKG
ncbi:Cullin family protein [Aspergillus niger]|uniref:Cullin family protein n=1 Tax=Aspergillus niger TaxID=5061 RepID=A0A505HYM8_ASPNG|nr:Cullin family protein [Aspergillus niger]